MMTNRKRYTRPLMLAVCLLLTSLFLLVQVFAAVPENRDSMQSKQRNSTADDHSPMIGAITDAADAVGDAVTDAGNAIGNVIGDVGDAAGELVSDAGNAIGDAADAIGGNADHSENGVTENAPSASGTMPYDSQSVVTQDIGSAAGSVTQNRGAGFTWVWILILIAAAAAVFFLLLMPGRRRET